MWHHRQKWKQQKLQQGKARTIADRRARSENEEALRDLDKEINKYKIDLRHLTHRPK